MMQKNIGLLLKLINIEYTRLMDTNLRAHGVSTAQAEALYYISIEQGLSQSMLKRHLGITAPSLSVLIDSLVAKRLVERQADQKDPRRVKLFLTPGATPIALSVAAIKKGIYAELRQNMSDAQLALLGEWLEQFLETLKQQSHPKSPAQNQAPPTSDCAN